MKPSRILVSIMALAALAILGPAQQKDGKESAKQKQDDSKSKQKEEQPPLFGKRLGYTASTTTKESTTLATKGVDENGMVDKEMLAKVPTADDRAKVQLLAQNRPNPDQLREFLRQGGLKEK